MEERKAHTRNKTEKATILLEELYSNRQPASFEDELRMWYFDNENRQEKDDALESVFSREVNEVVPDEVAFEKLDWMVRHLGLPEPTAAINEVRGITRNIKPTRKIISLRRRWMTGVAAALVLLISGTVGLLVERKADTTGQIAQITVSADGGVIREVVLPDNSTVLLYPEGTLTYPDKFTKSREVSVQGKAFFRVEKDPRKKFTVSADGMAITVHGTQFMVKAHEGVDYSSITLHSGSVEVKAGENEAAILSPGEKLGYYGSTGHVVINKVEVRDPLEPDLDFHKSDLCDIISTIGDYFKMEVEIIEELSQELKYTIDLTDIEDVDMALRLLSGTAQNFSYRIEENTIIIQTNKLF